MELDSVVVFVFNKKVVCSKMEHTTKYGFKIDKAKELENTIKKSEEKEERWFELSAKIEG